MRETEKAEAVLHSSPREQVGSKRNGLRKWHAEPAPTWCHIPDHRGTDRPDTFAAPGGCVGSKTESSVLYYAFACVAHTV